MINPFKLRKAAALLFAGFACTIAFYAGQLFYSFWIGLVILGPALIISVLIGNLLLKNPFTEMLEGKGVLAFNIDSTGIIQPFLVRIAQPYLHGNLYGKKIKDVFDRKTVFTLSAPKKIKKKGFWNILRKAPKEHKGGIADITKPSMEIKTEAPEPEKKKGGLTYSLSEKELNAARFGFLHWPCLIWNDHLGCFLTKEYISDLESTSFADHQILYMNRQMEDLTSSVRDFGRYVVEMLKPALGIFRSPWFWIILLVFIGIMILLFAPALMEQASSFVQGATNAASSGGSGAVTPQG